MAQNHEDLMSPEINVQRIMRTGTVWFATALLADVVFFGLLLASNWRPWMMADEGLEVIFCVGAAANVLSLGLVGWSGCPILEVSVPKANRNKTLTMQLGTLLLILSTAAIFFAVLMGPAAS